MRIEKINEKQIRCTLNQKDLTDREIRISELAYGTDKAKALFRDMMQQASYEFGFETENTPLMIEAIPMYPDTLVLVITKVDDLDELDTRFSTFSDSDDDLYEVDSEYDLDDSDLLDYDYPDSDDSMPFIPIQDGNTDTDFISLSDALRREPEPKKSETASSADFIRIYRFECLEDICKLAGIIKESYSGTNTLYKDTSNECFYLVLHKSDTPPENFNKICNIMNEYGSQTKNMYASHSYFEEHFEPFIQNKAIQVLASI